MVKLGCTLKNMSGVGRFYAVKKPKSRRRTSMSYVNLHLSSFETL